MPAAHDVTVDAGKELRVQRALRVVSLRVHMRNKGRVTSSVIMAAAVNHSANHGRGTTQQQPK